MVKSMQEKIVIRGARVHNLKNINLDIPRNKLVVITGLSGSGKSSLAFDTIYAEGQRRYVESLSAYARQFLGLMDKPDVDKIEGLSPAISIDQKSASHNPRSTVGTVTEIYDYLRLLFARVGIPHCPVCGKKITGQTVTQMVDQIVSWHESTKIVIMAPLVKDQKGEHKHVLEEAKKSGYQRVRFDGTIMDLGEALRLNVDKKKKHTIDIVVDRISLDSGDRARIADSLETALDLGNDSVIIQKNDPPKAEEILLSSNFACPEGHMNLPELNPRNFSFNSPHGACPDCTGLGTRLEINEHLVIPNPKLTFAEGAIRPWSKTTSRLSWYSRVLEAVAKEYGFSTHTPVKDLPKKFLDVVLYGTGDRKIKIEDESGYERFTSFEGVIPNLERKYKETDSDYMRSEIEQYMRIQKCPTCKGKRLKPEFLAVTIDDKSIVDVANFTIDEAVDFTEALPRKMSEKDIKIAHQIFKEIVARLKFLQDVGLNYLTLDRSADTLSGGEAQRIRLATQIGSGLTGVLYILDEPSIGLHQRDNDRLLKTLKNLRDLGNTVIVVEHDEETIWSSDWVVDIGPGAGKNGGQLVSEGTPAQVAKDKNSLTGRYLSGLETVTVPSIRKKGNGKTLRIVGATEHNLKNVDVEIPLGKFVTLTGVSGSGKSTLLNEILAKSLSAYFYNAKESPGEHKKILGIENIDKVINIDQSPIGRTPRSNPATYTGVFTYIRDLFAAVPEARLRGYKAGRFFFYVEGVGRGVLCGGGPSKSTDRFFPYLQQAPGQAKWQP